MDTSTALAKARAVLAVMSSDDDAQFTYDAAKAVVKLLSPFVTDYEAEDAIVEIPVGLTPGADQYDD